jgi:predicted transcriptional regulator
MTRKYEYGERLSARGGLNHNARLERSDLPLIQGLLRDGLTQAEIAEKFEVSKSLIRRVAIGELWICR